MAIGLIKLTGCSLAINEGGTQHDTHHPDWPEREVETTTLRGKLPLPSDFSVGMLE